MPARWPSRLEKSIKRKLKLLYYVKKMTLPQIAVALAIPESTAYARFSRLGLKADPSRKINISGRKKIVLPRFSARLAEFIGIMLGDGHISPSQVVVTLGTKEKQYGDFVAKLFFSLFGLQFKKISNAKKGYLTLYVGSMDILDFLKQMGLVENKVKYQIDIPSWIFKKHEYMKSFLRGLFDTDGSIYRLRFGWQISYCNRSLRLLKGIRLMLLLLNFSPSQISGYNICLTRRRDLLRFAREIGSKNLGKQQRFSTMGGWVSSYTTAL